jgi:serine/threonine protein phosphatase PrpC
MPSRRLAGVSDPGKRHSRNEDFVALAAAGLGEALVVCDGVSSSHTPDAAASAGAEAACAVIERALSARLPVATHTLAAALASAEEAVRRLPGPSSSDGEPPEATIVAAARQGRRLTVGWLGDSRAYLVSRAGARALTDDHSWINEVVGAGRMTRAEARRAPLAHAVTRTLGGRTHGDEPALRTIDLPDGAALLVLCTDGLWNYLPEPWQLAELIQRQPAGADAIDVARALVTHALDHDAHDNVTAAVLVIEEKGP